MNFKIAIIIDKLLKYDIELEKTKFGLSGL